MDIQKLYKNEINKIDNIKHSANNLSNFSLIAKGILYYIIIYLKILKGIVLKLIKKDLHVLVIWAFPIIIILQR